VLFLSSVDKPVGEQVQSINLLRFCPDDIPQSSDELHPTRAAAAEWLASTVEFCSAAAHFQPLAPNASR